VEKHRDWGVLVLVVDGDWGGKERRARRDGLPLLVVAVAVVMRVSNVLRRFGIDRIIIVAGG